ncbi:hypothetical protein [Azospirillum sp. B510]|uniref:hypothetical protein n=1 Tax=Azospirillum sp. (strain B510) TaxID=137722 RepID=UPI0011D14FBD|nr:hypothetical protein [Azospirillum sp. B510]
MTNAERQKKHRERIKALLRNAGDASDTSAPVNGCRTLPVIIAELPGPSIDNSGDDYDDSPQSFARGIMAAMQPNVINMVEVLIDKHPLQAREISDMFGLNIDPVRKLTWRQFHDTFQAAKLPKDELNALLGRAARQMVAGIRPLERFVWLSEAYTYRPLLERLGLWSVP